jgi:predicted amino acid dehydrogenase
MKNLFGVVMKKSWRIAEISYGRSHWDASYRFEFQNQNFEVQRFGCNFSVEYLKLLIQALRSEVDAIALVSLPPVIKFYQANYIHQQLLEILNFPSPVPICMGAGLKEICNLRSISDLIKQGKINPDLGSFFPGAFMCMELEELLRRRNKNSVSIGDAYALLGTPLVIEPFVGLKSLAKASYQFASARDLKDIVPNAESRIEDFEHSLLSLQVEKSQYIISDLFYLLLFADTSPGFTRFKDIVHWSHHPVAEKQIQKLGPRSMINLFPEEFKISPYINYSVLDAAFRLVNDRHTPFSAYEWEDLLKVSSDFVESHREFYISRRDSTQTQVAKITSFAKNKLRQRKSTIDFAFIVHSLSHKDYSRVPGMSFLNHLPTTWDNKIDDLLGKLPPVQFGSINHIISANTGREVNGRIYSLWETPRVLKNEDPTSVYKKILKLCEHASNDGAKIIGLGAYTKVIGDSGISINQLSPIPVTTGNSLSTSATLWAVHEVVKKMSLVPINPESGLFKGLAMIIGATGSIGKASAKLLSLVCENVCLVAPRIDRLKDLAAEINQFNPRCRVFFSTDANQFAGQTDVLVTATSAFDQKVIDINQVKPGCVICDCSRPLDFDLHDAKKRPDVLIIESGEVNLPGPWQITCDLGLPKHTVYACLAETAVLALEDRYESFTLGRDIEWTRVKEIYRMAIKHGVSLSAIQGHAGIITDKEIQLTQELANVRRKERAQRKYQED